MTPPVAPTRIPVVALVGNPNAGKTSLFNRLTGGRQKVGNYPGVTVEKVSGHVRGGVSPFLCVDVPGLYSLRPISADEAVAVGVLAGQDDGVPDAVVFVMDATNLERGLFLFSQVAEAGCPTVVALTLTDLAGSEGSQIDIKGLQAQLGVPVLPVVAHTGAGVDALKAAIDETLRVRPVPELKLGYPEDVETRVTALEDLLHRAALDVRRSEIRQALLEPGHPLCSRLSGQPELEAQFEAQRQSLLGSGLQAKTVDAQARYAWAGRVRRQVLSGGASSRRLSDRLDAVLTHRVFGLLIFVGLMYVVFQSIYTFAGPFMDAIESGVDWVKGIVGGGLDGMPMLRDLVVDGVVTGVGSMLVFLPQILILFLFIAVLEGSGYLARAAFLMDKLLGWCGLNGRAFIPLLSSFACAVPGIMSARVMPDARSRLATILVAPLMSCSARLPVYVLMIGAFIEPKYGAAWAGFALFAMHFVGLIAAVAVAWVFNRGLRLGARSPFHLELPRYQWPKRRDVWITVFTRAKVFVQTAGTIIVAMSIVIWALLYFPRSAEADARYREEYKALPVGAREARTVEHFVEERRTEESFLGRFGRAIAPVFAPAGFDWRMTTAILAAFPAREVVVPALNILFGMGSEAGEDTAHLTDTLAKATWPDGRPLMTVWTAVGLMLFFALCCQCMATLATIRQETGNWRWALFSFVYMTGLAYLGAVAVYQVGRLFA